MAGVACAAVYPFTGNSKVQVCHEGITRQIQNMEQLASTSQTLKSRRKTNVGEMYVKTELARKDQRGAVLHKAWHVATPGSWGARTDVGNKGRKKLLNLLTTYSPLTSP
ncbi:unnamed protein product [Gulo gulo]|uniref:Uncharacterized protein n=1 Tax=Gulo gulo TaxID=48420 RepID=A0A9X9LEP8_GULGU|nr:unnamed protein product [Gulo gulo]